MTADVHFCRPDEIDAVMRFVHTDWAAGHILSHHRPLVDFQHCRRDGSGHTFVLGYAEGRLVAVLGFIPTSHYDAALAAEQTVWLALWKARPDAGVAAIGILLLQHLMRHEPHTAVGVLGIGDAAQLPMYRALGFETGVLRQFVVARPSLASFRLARFAGPPPLPAPQGRAELKRLAPEALAEVEVELGGRAAAAPKKSPTYFLQRYAGHPLYRYRIHGVTLGGCCYGLLAARLATHDGARALRLVDYWGDPAALGEIGPALARLLEIEDAEYADFFCHGIPSGVLGCSGFVPLDPDGPTIVPNHFEPFVQKNGRIDFAMKTRRPGFVLCRADGDQDRPNRVEQAS